MFDRGINDDLAVVQEIVQEAVARASVPGTQSFGNAAGVYRAVSSGLIPASAGNTGASGAANGGAGQHFGESGVDENGKEFYPMIWGVDGFDGAAYWQGGKLR